MNQILLYSRGAAHKTVSEPVGKSILLIQTAALDKISVRKMNEVSE